MFHPLRWQRWAISDLNPMLWPLPSLASAVKARRRRHRRPTFIVAANVASDVITASLDLYRDLRDATMESLFFAIYGPARGAWSWQTGRRRTRAEVVDPRELPLVQNALDAIGTGGYPEAVALNRR